MCIRDRGGVAGHHLVLPAAKVVQAVLLHVGQGLAHLGGVAVLEGPLEHRQGLLQGEPVARGGHGHLDAGGELGAELLIQGHEHLAHLDGELAGLLGAVVPPPQGVGVLGVAVKAQGLGDLRAHGDQLAVDLSLIHILRMPGRMVANSSSEVARAHS